MPEGVGRTAALGAFGAAMTGSGATPRTRMGVLAATRRRVEGAVEGRVSLEAVFSDMCRSRSSSMDSKVADRCSSLSRAGPEGVPSWACSGVSTVVTNAWSCAVSTRGDDDDWGVSIEGLGGMGQVD